MSLKSHTMLRVELRRPHFDLRDRIVAVRVFADTVVSSSRWP
jgi:hypothetical protein